MDFNVSIVDGADISRNAKMERLQNAVTGRTRDAIAGNGYYGEVKLRFGQSCCGESSFESYSAMGNGRFQKLQYLSMFKGLSVSLGVNGCT